VSDARWSPDTPPVNTALPKGGRVAPPKALALCCWLPPPASLARATIRSHRNGGNVPGAGTIRASGEKVSRGSLQRNWSYARQLVEAPIPRHGWPLKFRTRTTSQRRLSSRPYTSPEHSSGRPQQWRPCSSSPGTGPCSSAARRSQAPTSATRTVGEAAPVMTAHAC